MRIASTWFGLSDNHCVTVPFVKLLIVNWVDDVEALARWFRKGAIDEVAEARLVLLQPRQRMDVTF